MELLTQRLKVILLTREEVQEMISAMPERDRAQVSPEWLALVRASTEGEPWTRAFRARHRDGGADIGSCSFKGPPVDGVVEVAYAVEPGQEGNGYATEMAQVLVDHAFTYREVCLVRAHTLPSGAASQRVLLKCGFQLVGEVEDPEDGTVCRFEKRAFGGFASQ